MVTSEPVRDNIVALTRSMSAATSSTRWSIEAPEGLSKGTITATQASTFAQFALSSDITIETAGYCGKGTKWLTSRAQARTSVRHRRASIAGIGSDQRYRAGFGDRRAA